MRAFVATKPQGGSHARRLPTRAEVRQLAAWRPVAFTQALRERAWEIEDQHRLSWWDALVVAAAQQARCTTLLTEDLQDGLELDGLRVVNPFVRDLSLPGRAAHSSPVATILPW